MLGNKLSHLLSPKSNVTDQRIAEHIKRLQEQDSDFYSSVIKELSKLDTFTSKTYIPKDWAEVEVPEPDPIIEDLLELSKARAEGFKFEFGRNKIKYPNKVLIEDPERDVPYPYLVTLTSL
jgi:hypothetical protein